jgi:hypothetical protein
MGGQSREYREAREAAEEDGHHSEGQYQPVFAARATDYCLLGATNEELADLFNVGLSTIQQWLVERPIFARAVHRGRIAADARVARSMFKAATGAKVKKQKAFVIDGAVQVVDIVEQMPPNVAAGNLWLTNRQRSKWRDSKAVDASSGVNLLEALQRIAGDAAKVIEGQAEVADKPKDKG